MGEAKLRLLPPLELVSSSPTLDLTPNLMIFEVLAVVSGLGRLSEGKHTGDSALSLSIIAAFNVTSSFPKPTQL